MRIRNLKIAASFAVTTILLLTVGVSGASAVFGIEPGSFDGNVSDQAGAAFTQAGGHPHSASTTFTLNRIQSHGFEIPDGNLRNVRVDLPPGLVGNPSAAPACSQDLKVPSQTDSFKNPDPSTICPLSSIVGIAVIKFVDGPNFSTNATPVFNLDPGPGLPAQFVFSFQEQEVYLSASLRSDGDYGVSVSARNISQAAPVVGTSVTLWGVPADHSHDSQRCVAFNVPVQLEPIPDCNFGFVSPLLGPNPAGVPRKAFITNPTACTTPSTGLETRIHIESWQQPMQSDDDSFVSHNPPGTDILNSLPPESWGLPQGPTGCDQVPFDPTISLQPTSTQADSPTGLNVDISAPVDGLLDPDGTAQSHLKQAVVTLPEGMTVNPSSASGLGSCSPAELAAESADSEPGAGCPLDSKIGTVEVETPLLEESMGGSVYLAKQNDNPFNSLLALYIVVKSPERGIVIKLKGKVEPDPRSGKLVTTFDDNPQLPFSNLHLELKSGSRAPLITPPTCGTHTTTVELSPWARPDQPVGLSNSFKITSGPEGKPCPSDSQFDPSFNAGTLTPIAGSYSPLIVNASRPDGSQPLSGLKLDLPEGLVGKLAGIPYCSDAALASAAGKAGATELASPSCPAASKVGTVDVGAGAGSTPFHVTGQAYLAGPYKGAPLSIAVITPAVAGPFDLGTVVVRAKADVDPATAQIHVVSDPIPTILQGIPLKVRSVSVNTDKPNFTLNPTDCDPMSFTGTLLSPSASKLLASRFQVGACKALDFKPKLALKLSGKTHRSAYPALKATLSMPNSSANIARAAVTLPKTEILEQAHIKTICTRVQYAAKACPQQSVYGYAKAWSPLLDQPLQGPVYLRSSSHKLPDLIASLDGQIHIDLQGRIDSVNARIRNTFDLVPDAPVSRFVLTMQGGKKGLLVNNTELCKAKPRADVRFDAQSGKVSDSNPLAKVDCGGKGRKK